jgi:hypothetical protein
MKEKIVCGMSIFFLAEKALIPTEANIPAGYSISTEPVSEFDYRDREAFREALWEAIITGNPSVANPPDSEIIKDSHGFPRFKNPLELKYAGVDSWEELERASVYASVCSYPSGYIVEAFGRAADGTWSDERVLSERVAIDDGIDAVIDVLIAHIDSRSDLPVSKA